MVYLQQINIQNDWNVFYPDSLIILFFACPHPVKCQSPSQSFRGWNRTSRLSLDDYDIESETLQISFILKWAAATGLNVKSVLRILQEITEATGVA